MSRLGLLLALVLLAGCVDRYETLRPHAGPTERALRAIVAKPPGTGPFPVAIILHGSAGPRPNGERWAAEIRELGYMTVVPDQYGPLGITDTLTRQGALWDRFRDTHSLVRHLQSRSDVQPDRIVVMGFSQGGLISTGVMTPQWDLMDPPGSPPMPRPAGGINFYSLCTFFPSQLHGPLLLLLGGADDWTPVTDCQDWVRGVRSGPQPRLVIYPGVHHGFDEPEIVGPIFMARYHNPHRQTGWGATVGYDRVAHAASRREVMEFLQALR